MAKKIPLGLINEVRSKTNIVTLIGQRQTLVKSGTSWRGGCPICKAEGGTLCVVPRAGIFSCFDCGSGGDAFTYLMRVDGLTFLSAFHRLALLAEVTPPPASSMVDLLRDTLDKVESGLVRSLGVVIVQQPGGLASMSYRLGDGVAQELADGATHLAEIVREEAAAVTDGGS